MEHGLNVRLTTSRPNSVFLFYGNAQEARGEAWNVPVFSAVNALNAGARSDGGQFNPGRSHLEQILTEVKLAGKLTKKTCVMRFL